MLNLIGHLCYGLSNNAVERIINGSDTNINLVPYMVSRIYIFYFNLARRISQKPSPEEKNVSDKSCMVRRGTDNGKINFCKDRFFKVT